MLVAAICDACHHPLFQRATNVQLQAGELVVTQSGIQMRNTQSLESYNFCDRCVTTVRLALDSLRRPPIGMLDDESTDDLGAADTIEPAPEPAHVS